MPDNKDKKDPNKNKINFGNNRFALIFLIILLTMFMMLFFVNGKESITEIPYSVFLGYLENNDIESVNIVDQSEVIGTLKSRSGGATSFKSHIPYINE